MADFIVDRVSVIVCHLLWADDIGQRHLPVMPLLRKTGSVSRFLRARRTYGRNVTEMPNLKMVDSEGVSSEGVS